jgi:hypothetical protein
VFGKALLRASSLFLVVATLVGACGGDDDNAGGGPNGAGGPDGGPNGSSGGPGGGDAGDGAPPLPPRQDPVVATDHPRILFPQGRDRLKAKVTANDAPTARFLSMVDKQLGGAKYYGFQPWNAGLVGQLNGDPKYCAYAVAQTDTFVASEEALIAGGKAPSVASDTYYSVGDDIGNVALTFDFCFSTLTADQRTRWGNYAGQAIHNLWNNTTATWGGNPFPWDGWSVNNPNNNYHYAFLRATMTVALAFNKELAEAPGWVDLFRKDKLAKLFDEFTQNLAGGGSREGTGYGMSQRTLFEVYDLWQESTGERVWDLTPATRPSLPLIMHYTVPTMDRVAAIGDQARDSSAGFYDYHRQYALELQYMLGPTDPLAQIAETWLEGVSVTQMSSQFLYVYDFLFGNPSHPKQPLTALTPSLVAPGVGYTVMRSGWTNDATWGLFMVGPYTESHAHHDQGSLLIYKNAWLGIDENIGTTSGIQQGEDLHNLVRLVKGGKTVAQKVSDKPSLLAAFQTDANVTFASGKMQDIYDQAAVTRIERDVAFIRPLETFVVFDRIEADVDSAVWQFSMPSAPTQAGGKWTTSPTGGSLDVFPLLPSGAAPAIVGWPSVNSDFKFGSRMDITSGGHTRYLAVFSPGKVQTATVDQNGGNSTATLSFVGGASGTVSFSTDGSGGHVTINGGGVTIDTALGTTFTQPALLAQ